MRCSRFGIDGPRGRADPVFGECAVGRVRAAFHAIEHQSARVGAPDAVRGQAQNFIAIIAHLAFLQFHGFKPGQQEVQNSQRHEIDARGDGKRNDVTAAWYPGCNRRAWRRTCRRPPPPCHRCPATELTACLGTVSVATVNRLAEKPRCAAAAKPIKNTEGHRPIFCETRKTGVTHNAQPSITVLRAALMLQPRLMRRMESQPPVMLPACPP